MSNIKLHLGCGKVYIPGFVHIDLSSYPHIDYQHDISYLPMFKNNTVCCIYASHVLEHFGRYDTINILKEWYRVLAPKGILRLAVPDFEAVVKVYGTNKDMNQIMGLLYGGQDSIYNYHHAVFDFQSLSSLLLTAGFNEVHRYNWRNTIHKDYDDYSQAYIPHMDKEHGTLMSLNVEAMK